MVEMLVTQMRYQVMGNNIDVNIFGRTADGRRIEKILRGFEPYFYVNQEPKSHQSIKRVVKEGQDLLGNELWKIYTKNPYDVPKVRMHYAYHYEADIPFTDRVRFDLGIKHQIDVPENKHVITRSDVRPVERTIDPVIFYFDIETDDSRGFAAAEFAAGPVRCVSAYDTKYEKLFVIIDGKANAQKIKDEIKRLEQKYFNEDGPDVVVKMAKDERDLFSKFTSLLKHIDPDIITGWNSDGYDIPYMTNRATNNNYPIVNFRIYSAFDTQWGYKTLHKNKAHMKLEYAAKKVLGTGKIPRKRICDMFEDDKESLAIYNIWDTELTRRIEQVKGIINPFHLNLAWFAGCGLENAKWQEPLADKYMLHQTAGIVVVPTREFLDDVSKIEGGFVKEAVFGIYNFVCVLDFSSMYPLNILSTNISPETRVHKDPGDGSVFKLGTGRMYKKEPMGLIPIVIEKLIGLRTSIKEKMKKHPKNSTEYKALWEQQRATKYFTNAVYGVLGSKHFRLADAEAANDVTYLGRELIKFTIDEVAKMGYRTLYADTDSVMFEANTDTLEEAVEVALKVAKDLNKLYPTLAKSWNGEKESKFSLKCEKIYEGWFQPGAKKRYAGLVGWDGDTDEKFLTHLPPKDRLDIKGLEIVRSNSAKITKEVQEKVVIESLSNPDYRDLIIRYLSGVYKDFFDKKLDNKLCIPTSWSKMEYAVVPAHEKGRRFSQACGLINIQPGDSYSWFYVKKVEGMPRTNVAAIEFDLDEVPEIIHIDYEKMWERTVRKPLEALLKGLNITWEEIILGKVQDNVGDWL